MQVSGSPGVWFDPSIAHTEIAGQSTFESHRTGLVPTTCPTARPVALRVPTGEHCRPPTNPSLIRSCSTHRPTDGAAVQRHEVLDWLGPVDLYADRANRLEPPTRPVPPLTEQQINQRDAGKTSPAEHDQ